MQVQAIVEAALQLKAEAVHVLPEIMIPLIGHISELTTIESRLRATAEHVQQRVGDRIDYKFGTMLEVPRACLTATEIAAWPSSSALAPTTSHRPPLASAATTRRAASCSSTSKDGILVDNPFGVLDRDGVGALMRTATEQGRAARADIEVGSAASTAATRRLSISASRWPGLRQRLPVPRASGPHRWACARPPGAGLPRSIARSGGSTRSPDG